MSTKSARQVQMANDLASLIADYADEGVSGLDILDDLATLGLQLVEGEDALTAYRDILTGQL